MRAVEELSRKPDGASAERDELRRGWCLGAPVFRERMLGLLESAKERVGRQSRRDARVEHDYGWRPRSGCVWPGSRLWD